MNHALAPVVIRRAEVAALGARRAHGATGFLTWVIAGNRGARKFYEELGGEPLVGQPFERDGMNLVETGYGRRDLDALAAACASTPAKQHPHPTQTQDGRAA